ncbi:MAG TPA: HDIG domain-containing protein [Dysgonomonas sp.]|uniref:HD domain-containing protein n=1 Tax=unclassified Dysgonomonas TaxID=2630389 RepID=UPI0025C2B08A|nr:MULTISPECIES: HD domain-containing protein [unclassified Dysgonomonas]HML65601.1 HDIG domain-containing protein [Dysgonomonas sp.]
MDVIAIIEKYYKKDSDLYKILIRHSKEVMNKALEIAKKHPELNADIEFIKEAAMLHDIGIFLTNAPSIECNGIAPYVCHGYLGRELLDAQGYHRHALVCERHTGVGISLEEIKAENLPLPHRNMQPMSIEEKIICFADCFYSKTNLGVEKSIDKIRKGLEKHGINSVKIFDEWSLAFL